MATFGSPIGAAFVIALIELAVVERQQVRMMFTLADLHAYALNNEHFHEIGDLYGQVLKIKGASRAASYARAGSIALFRALSIRFLQRAAIKYCIPVVAVVVGGGMNWVLTTLLGRHCVKRFRRERTMAEHMEAVLKHDRECQRLLLSLMALMASCDGPVDRTERRFILRTLDAMGIYGADREAMLESLEFREDVTLDALNARDDPEFDAVVVEVLSLMSVADGGLSPNEQRLLMRVCAARDIEIDPQMLLDRHTDFVHPRRRRAARETLS